MRKSLSLTGDDADRGWIECVPNFSHGQSPDILEKIGQAAMLPGVQVLGLEADPDHNRAVMTLAGPGPEVVEAAFRAAAAAVELIDLRHHQGTHPRIGAVDVMPLIPLGTTSMDRAIAWSRVLGARLGQELDLPVYLYNLSATMPERRRLADVRRGQFEGLAARMAQDPPDFGPPRPHLTAGAVAVGARRPLIAFNCYLATQDMAIARKVARRVRASSGGLVGVQALAMDTVHQGMVQVSMNLVDYPRTPLPQAVEMVRLEATRLGVVLARSELVGLMPMQALLDCASYYLQCPDLSVDDVVEWAITESSRPYP